MGEEKPPELVSGFNWTAGLLSFAVSAFFAGGGFIFAAKFLPDTEAAFVGVIGLVFGLFFTLLALPYVRIIWVALVKPVILRIGDEGLYYAVASDDTIPWDKVIAVVKSKNKHTTSFNVYVDPALPVRPTLLARLLGAADQNVMAIASNVVRANEDDVHLALERHLPEEKRRNMPYWVA
ncbi:MAG: hypothetical protein HQL44_12110 [Alphaproteobacteria bacterium]|nr:hypothetical protein [Alphaproteobacteria bacterium]